MVGEYVHKNEGYVTSHIIKILLKINEKVTFLAFSDDENFQKHFLDVDFIFCRIIFAFSIF